MLLLAGAQILSGYVYDTVRINIESNLDLRDSTGSRSDTVQTESTDGLVVLSELTLALEYVDINARLVIGICGEDLALLCRNGGVTLDHSCANAACGFDTEGQRSYIEQQQTGDFLVEHTALDRSADCNALIRVDTLERLLAEEVLYSVLNCRDSCGTADQKDLVDLALVKAGIGDSLLQRTHCGLYQVSGQLVELSPCEGYVQVLRTSSVSGDIRDIYVYGS